MINERSSADDMKTILEANMGEDYTEGVSSLVDAIAALKAEGSLDIEDVVMLSSMIYRWVNA